MSHKKGLRACVNRAVSGQPVHAQADQGLLCSYVQAAVNRLLPERRSWSESAM